MANSIHSLHEETVYYRLRKQDDLTSFSEHDEAVAVVRGGGVGFCFTDGGCQAGAAPGRCAYGEAGAM